MSSSNKQNKLDNLGNAIYDLIQKHYQSKSKQLLSHCVKTQIIPLLIEIFFQNHSTRPLFKDKNQKRVSQRGSPFKEKSSKTWFPTELEKENIMELENILSDKTPNPHNDHIVELKQKSCTKIAGACFLFMKINEQIIRKKKQFFSQIQGKRKQATLGILTLQSFANKSRTRAVLIKFYQNFKEREKQTIFFKALHKLYLQKVNGYWKKILSLQTQNMIKIQKIHKKMKDCKISFIKKLLLHRKKQAFEQIKQKAFTNNKWMSRWVYDIILKTNTNLETSFLRLKQNANNNPRKNQKKKINFQDSLNKGISLDHKEKITIFISKLKMIQQTMECKYVQMGFDNIKVMY